MSIAQNKPEGKPLSDDRLAEVRRLRDGLTLATDMVAASIPVLEGHVRLAMQMLGGHHEVTLDAQVQLQDARATLARLRALQAEEVGQP